MNAQVVEALIEKLKALPPHNRETDQHLARGAAQISEPAFKTVWDNPDDAEYDRL